jgi:acyl carrier protein
VPAPSEVEDRIRAFLAARCGVPAETIAAATRFDALGIDSFDLVTLLIEVEDAYGVVVTDAEAAQLDTVGDAAAFIAARAGESAR